jgi:hypothetical protein
MLVGDRYAGNLREISVRFDAEGSAIQLDRGIR